MRRTTSRAVTSAEILEPRSSWPNPSIPSRGVELRTVARLLPADDLTDAIRIATRYVGPEKGAEYVEGAGYDSVIARLEPGHLRIWDFDDE